MKYSLAVLALAAIVGGLVYQFLPLPTTTGRINYLVNSYTEGVLTPNYWNKRDPDKDRAMYGSLITRRELLNVALAEPNVASQPMFGGADPILYLQENLKVEFVNPELLRVSLEGRDSAELLVVLKAIHSAFMKAVYDREIMRRRERLRTLTEAVQEQYAKSKALKEMATLDDSGRADLENAETAISRINSEIGSAKLEMNAAPRVAAWEEPHTVAGIAGHERRNTALAVAAGVLALGLVIRILSLGGRTRSAVA